MPRTSRNYPRRPARAAQKPSSLRRGDIGHVSRSRTGTRCSGNWDGVGERTIAGHTGLAVVEWHVHAWDLARSAGRDHRPADPATVAAGYRLPDEPVGCEGDPWTNILLAACRKPGEVRAS